MRFVPFTPGTRPDGTVIDPATYDPGCADCHADRSGKVSERDCQFESFTQEHLKRANTVTQWNEATRKIMGPEGVVPVPPDWRDSPGFDFTDYICDPAHQVTYPNLWVFPKSEVDGMQMLYARPLTAEQRQKITEPR